MELRRGGNDVHDDVKHNQEYRSLEEEEEEDHIDHTEERARKLENCREQTSINVLAVDDSRLDRKLLEKLLSSLSSYQVTCVESGDKALEYLGLPNCNSSPQRSNYDERSALSDSASAPSNSESPMHQQVQELKVNLIITDYFMPGMSGYDLLQRLKGSSWKDVPVVVMSSENVPSIINMCLEAGAEDFLLKPVQLKDLKKLQHQFTQSSPTDDDHDSDEETVG